MRHKVVWLSLWTTLSLWLGSIGGCATHTPPAALNNNPQRTTTQVSKDIQAIADYMLPWTCAVPSPEPTTKVAPPATQLTSQPASSGESMGGFDRSHWPQVIVRPESGSTTHYPIYFTDVSFAEFYHHVFGTVCRMGKTPLNPDTVFANAEAQNWDRWNTRASFIQPLKFCFDLGVLPVRLLQQPPLRKNVTTP